MLKIEPTEAENVLLPFPEKTGDSWLFDLARELDASVRSEGDGVGRTCADEVILRDALGLSRADCQLLRTAGDVLRDRRYSRSVS